MTATATNNVVLNLTAAVGASVYGSKSFKGAVGDECLQALPFLTVEGCLEDLLTRAPQGTLVVPTESGLSTRTVDASWVAGLAVRALFSQAVFRLTKFIVGIEGVPHIPELDQARQGVVPAMWADYIAGFGSPASRRSFQGALQAGRNELAIAQLAGGGMAAMLERVLAMVPTLMALHAKYGLLQEPQIRKLHALTGAAIQVLPAWEPLIVAHKATAG